MTFKITKDKLKTLLVFSAPLIIALIISNIISLTIFSNQEKFASWLASLGPWIIAVYALLQAITLIIPPLGGFVLLVSVIAILGPLKGFLLSYLVSTPIFIVNFLIARKFGRPMVKKIAGEAAIIKIDQYAQEMAIPILILLKLFQNGYFDFISYAAGLTRIPLKSFIIVNVLGGIPSTCVMYLIMKNAGSFTLGVLLIYLISGLFIVSAFPLLKLYKKRQKN